ncbi:MAG: hypothetical protein H7839_14965 [Magnetococcus sp. YQC-5]
MPQSSCEIETIKGQEVARVLVFYSEKFTKYLSTTISVSEKIPEEINNHIRNAFTHLARVQFCVDEDKIRSEANQAINHIERANRDCLKASIICTRDTLNEMKLDVYFHHGSLTPAIDAQYKKIQQMREEAYAIESRGDDDQTQKLEEILRLILHTTEQIKEQYQEVGSKKTRIIRVIKRWFRPVIYAPSIIIGTIFGVIIKTYAEDIINFFKILIIH